MCVHDHLWQDEEKIQSKACIHVYTCFSPLTKKVSSKTSKQDYEYTAMLAALYTVGLLGKC